MLSLRTRSERTLEVLWPIWSAYLRVCVFLQPLRTQARKHGLELTAFDGVIQRFRQKTPTLFVLFYSWRDKSSECALRDTGSLLSSIFCFSFIEYHPASLGLIDEALYFYTCLY